MEGQKVKKVILSVTAALFALNLMSCAAAYGMDVGEKASGESKVAALTTQQSEDGKHCIGESGTDCDGVTFTLTDVYLNECELPVLECRLENATDCDVKYWGFNSVEKQVDGEWVDCERRLLASMPECTLESGETQEYSCLIEGIDVPKTGLCRVCVHFEDASGKKGEMWATFTLEGVRTLE